MELITLFLIAFSFDVPIFIYHTSILCCAVLCLAASDFFDPMAYSPLGSCVHGDSPGNALLQGIFSTWGSNPGGFFSSCATRETPGVS